MSPVAHRRIFALLGGGIGFWFGLVFAEHLIARKIAYAREKWGWVCGTGLDAPLYFWPPICALVGAGLGVLLSVWILARRQPA